MQRLNTGSPRAWACPKCGNQDSLYGGYDISDAEGDVQLLCGNEACEYEGDYQEFRREPDYVPSISSRKDSDYHCPHCNSQSLVSIHDIGMTECRSCNEVFDDRECKKGREYTLQCPRAICRSPFLKIELTTFICLSCNARSYQDSLHRHYEEADPSSSPPE